MCCVRPRQGGFVRLGKAETRISLPSRERRSPAGDRQNLCNVHDETTPKKVPLPEASVQTPVGVSEPRQLRNGLSDSYASPIFLEQGDSARLSPKAAIFLTLERRSKRQHQITEIEC